MVKACQSASYVRSLHAGKEKSTFYSTKIAIFRPLRSWERISVSGPHSHHESGPVINGTTVIVNASYDHVETEGMPAPCKRSKSESCCLIQDFGSLREPHAAQSLPLASGETRDTDALGRATELISESGAQSPPRNFVKRDALAFRSPDAASACTLLGNVATPSIHGNSGPGQ